MGFPILVRQHLYIESAPWCLFGTRTSATIMMTQGILALCRSPQFYEWHRQIHTCTQYLCHRPPSTRPRMDSSSTTAGIKHQPCPALPNQNSLDVPGSSQVPADVAQHDTDLAHHDTDMTHAEQTKQTLAKFSPCSWWWNAVRNLSAVLAISVAKSINLNPRYADFFL